LKDHGLRRPSPSVIAPALVLWLGHCVESVRGRSSVGVAALQTGWNVRLPSLLVNGASSSVCALHRSGSPEPGTDSFSCFAELSGRLLACERHRVGVPTTTGKAKCVPVQISRNCWAVAGSMALSRPSSVRRAPPWRGA